MQTKYWCYTDNQSTTKLDKIFPGKVAYCVQGQEVGARTEKVHLQGYLQFHKKQRFTAVKKLLPGCHIEPQAGTNEQARDYCKKEGKWEERGIFTPTKGKQGKRTDLDKYAQAIKDGATEMDIVENPDLLKMLIKYPNGTKTALQWRQYKVKNLHIIKKILVFYGETGTGKTTSAYARANDDYFEITGDQLQKGWWDGYQQEKSVIIDEYDSQVPITRLIKLLDPKVSRLNVKGSHTYGAYDTIIITSNLHPADWHPKAKPEHREALLRRLREWGEIYEFSNDKVTRHFL